MGKHQILLIHDNKQDFKSLADFLVGENYNVESVESEADLDDKVISLKPDLILLPVELSSNNGIDLCHNIKAKNESSNVFVILISKRKEDFSLIAGLESGADDFLFHPVHERVLLSRIKALLKRKKWTSSNLEDGSLVIDQDRYLIISQGVEYYLPKKEFEILSLLYSKPNKVFSREEIKNAIWDNFEKVRGRTVDVHIRKIREKIGEGLITTVKGVGYRLELN